MATLASSLLDFLMNLFNDPEAAADFLEDPEQALEDAGLGGVCWDDVEAVLPVVVDYAPITVSSSFDREYNTGGNATGNFAGNTWAPVAAAPAAHVAPAHVHHDDDHGHAVAQLHSIVNNYTYTSTTDDRDTITDQSVNQNIWANGDVTQLFDNDAVVASGDGAIAAGDDVEIDESEDNSTNITVGDIEIDDSFNEDNDTDIDVDIDDSYNEDNDGVDGDGNVVGGSGSGAIVVGDDNAVGNEDNDGVDGDGNIVGTEGDVIIGDGNVTGDENVVGDGNVVGNDTEIDVEVGDIVGGDQVGGDQAGGDIIDVGDVTVGDIVGGDNVGGDNVGGDLIDVGDVDVEVGDIVGGDLVEGPVVGGDLIEDVEIGDVVGGDVIEVGDVDLDLVGGDLIEGPLLGEGAVIGDIDADLDVVAELPAVVEPGA
ncbi:IniB N-terminal domain-containing protein [Arthrobacter sp. NamB2]|uniref:IniB N-terminal domain-containing protein n=1 Tax=Arthrobacter sp. NamB2 TaxID=2576035 RepID=UPI001672B28F|nr:IniB N-terminal domain-containing protein [Arthrobacter sp. NamB2]